MGQGATTTLIRRNICRPLTFSSGEKVKQGCTTFCASGAQLQKGYFTDNSFTKTVWVIWAGMLCVWLAPPFPRPGTGTVRTEFIF